MHQPPLNTYIYTLVFPLWIHIQTFYTSSYRVHRDRDEIGGVCNCPLSWSVYTATLYVMVNIVKRGRSEPPTLSVHGDVVIKFQPALLKRKKYMKFLLAYLKILTNSKDCYESRNTILVLLSFSHWSILSSVDSWISEQLFNSQAAIRKPEQAS